MEKKKGIKLSSKKAKRVIQIFFIHVESNVVDY